MTDIASNHPLSGPAASYATGDTLSLAVGSYLMSDDDHALVLGGSAQSYDLTVDGLIGGPLSEFANGLYLIASNTAQISIGATGSIQGYNAIYLEGGATVTNNGSIVGLAAAGIVGLLEQDTTVNNTGRVYGALYGIGYAADATGEHTIVNSGLISGGAGAISSEAGLASAETITNSGTIFGDVFLEAGSDSVSSIDGIIRGTVDLGDGQDQFYGGRSNDHVLGGGDYDLIDGGAGDDTMEGGSGDDDYFIDSADDMIVEAVGDMQDYAYTSVSYTLSADAEIERLYLRDPSEKRGLTLTLNAVGATDAMANAGNNTLTALDNDGFVDTLQGLGGDDIYVIGDYLDEIVDTGGNDTIRTTLDLSLTSYFGVDNITLTGSHNAGAIGNFRANVLTGNSGRNQLEGAGGDDRLVGGLGTDKLFGGAGRDLFDFNKVAESGLNGARDTIFDFRSGFDRIDLRTIDAIAGGADNAFHLLARGSAVDAGGIGYYWADKAGTANDLTILRFNTDGDAGIEMSIAITGLHTMKVGDFLL